MAQALDGLLAMLQRIAPRVGALAPQAEREARLSDEIARALAQGGFYRLMVPRSLGGLELPFPEVLRVIEAASAIDGALGWAVMIGAGGGPFAAFMEREVAQALFGPADALVAGSGVPAGTAERVEGGYRVSGRWRYASGASRATVFTANCMVADDGGPQVRAMAFAPEQVTLLGGWDSAGLRATDSQDFAVDDVFVPEARSFSIMADAPREPGPLYRLPFGALTGLSLAAVATGIAGHAVEAFASLARSKSPPGCARPLGEDASATIAYAAARADLAMARAGLGAMADGLWREVEADCPLDAALLADCSALVARAAGTLHRTVEELSPHLGMPAITADGDFARARRDLAAAVAHVALSPRNLAEAGLRLLADGMAAG